MAKLTKEQKKKYKAIIGDFDNELSAQEGNEAIEFKTAKQMPKQVWACTPEIKLKPTQMAYDLQLTAEQTKGGVIRIIRTGSNRIKICSMVLTKDLNDGYAEAKAIADKKANKNDKSAKPAKEAKNV